MSILRALRAPFRGLGVPDEILDFLERFLNVGFEFRARCDDTAATKAVPGKNAQDGSMSRSSHHSANSSNPKPSVDQ